jgi:hypothetical protein
VATGVRVTQRRVILGAALIWFLIYAYPGYIGWDTEAHLMQARQGIYSDAHPPILPALWRVCEVFVHGPLLMLLIQASALLVGLDRLFRQLLAERPAAIATACVFVFPPVAGVTAIVIKDAMMAGFLVLGIAALGERKLRPALMWMLVASTMRWNALCVTWPLLVALWPLGTTRVRRVAQATAAWLAITLASFAINAALVDVPAHMWYGTHAYMDIAGTVDQLDIDDDDAVKQLIAGVPIAGDGNYLADRIRATYDPADYRQLAWGPDRLFNKPAGAVQRAAVAEAWKRVVFGHPWEYLRYRWDNFKNLLRIDKQHEFAHVYVWFTVIAVPESKVRLMHDATASRVQGVMQTCALWLSNSPVYWPWIYFLVAVAGLIAWRRETMIAALLASGLLYECAWFVLNPTGDFRYSQWMILTVAIAVAWRIGRSAGPRTLIAKHYSKTSSSPSAQRDTSQTTMA